MLKVIQAPRPTWRQKRMQPIIIEASRLGVPVDEFIRSRAFRSWDRRFGDYNFVTTTDQIEYGGSGYTTMTVTNLQTLASDSTDPFTSWQSDRVDNAVSTPPLAIDYEIFFHVADTGAPGGDGNAYVYLVPWIYDGSSWHAAANFSTTTAPTGSEGTASFSEPNSMKGPLAVPYKVSGQPLDAWFTVTLMCGGGVCPDGWSLAIRNNTGQSFNSGAIVAYRTIKYTNS